MPPGEDATQKSSSPLHVSPSQKSLLASLKKRPQGDNDEVSVHGPDQNHIHGSHNKHDLSVLVSNNILYDSLVASGTLRWKHFLFSPVRTFHIIKEAREEASLLTPSEAPRTLHTDGFNLPLVGEVKWEVIKQLAKDWLRNPKNLALLLWGTAVGISGAILFLVMVGFLDHAIQKKSERDAWFEVNNQILNALFTLMCLYLHPQRFHDLFMLYRYQPEDIKKLRESYCKGGTYKPNEWVHMLVVVLLLHLNCFAQYALCGLNWGFKRSQRPAIGVGLCLAVAIGAPAAAGIYTFLSPLGKDFEESEALEFAEREEMEMAQKRKLDEKPSLKIGRGWKLCKKASFVSRDGKLVNQPEWRGGLFDCYSDPTVGLFTTFCGFCVFGWNMDRLGFGNRYVHIVTFILLCTAPYWIFTLAAITIDNTYVRHGLNYGGIILCVFGLLYGGFWRIQMRKTFGLPPQKWCLGQPNLTDCTQWLFCSLCSLCQEVRTSEYYKIHDNKFFERRTSPEASPPARWISPGPSPLGREASSPAFVSSPGTSSMLSMNHALAVETLKQPQEAPLDYPEIVIDKAAMAPPIPLVLVKDETVHI